MQLYQLRYVVTVADEGGFTRAAIHLKVAQPSVSAGVRALEKELGVELFRRSGSETAITPAGQAVLPWLRQALADCEAARAAVGDLMVLREGRLAVGAPPSLTTELLAPVLGEFHQRYPGVRLSVRERGSRHLTSALERDELDLAVVILPISHPMVRIDALVDEELVLAVPHDHPAASLSGVSICSLESTPLVMFREGYDVRNIVMRACRSAGVTPTFSAEGLEMGGVLALTAAGLGAAVVPISIVDPRGPLVAVPFDDVRLHRSVGLASRQDRTMRPAADALVDVLRAVVAGRQ